MRDEVGQLVELCRASFSRHMLPEDALEKVTRVCTLLVNAAVLDRAVAHGYKAAVLGKLDRIGEALAAYREGQQLYSMAATQLGEMTCETVPSDVAYSSLAVLFELGTLLESANQLVESEQTYIELLSTLQLPVPNRIQCLYSLAHVSN